MPFALKSIQIEHFQGITNLKIDNIPLNTQWIFLTGENSFGKTSLLRAIARVLAGAKSSLKMNFKNIIYWLSMLFVTQWACQNPTPKPAKPPKLITVAPSQTVVPPAIRPIERDKRTGLQLLPDDLALHWEKLKCGLWKSKKNDIGYQTSSSSERFEDDHDYFVTKFGLSDPDAPTLKSVIDVVTFKSIDGEYFKDKNHVYHDFRMAGGSNFGIMGDADAKTFQALSNGHHYKDKKHILVERHGEMEMADVKTFKTCARCGYYAKDKNGFYYRENRIAPSEIPDSIMVRLKKL